MDKHAFCTLSCVVMASDPWVRVLTSDGMIERDCERGVTLECRLGAGDDRRVLDDR